MAPTTAFCAALPLAQRANGATRQATHPAPPALPSQRPAARIAPRAELDGLPAANLVQISAPPQETLFGAQGFSSLGLLPELAEALTAMGITHPTAIQSRGIPPVMGGTHVILGAATGSGKTLAYLLPVVQALKVAEALRKPGDRPLRIAHRPRAVVLVPTRELAAQVGHVAKQLSYHAKLRVVAVDGGGSLRGAKDALMRPVDVLIATTGRLLQLLDARVVDLRFASHVVVDEVDTMFDAGFEPELTRLLAAVRRRPEDVPPPQCVAAGATHPRAAEALYAKAMPGAARINAALHRAPAGLTQRFVEVRKEGKLAELDALLGEAQTHGLLRGGRMVVFCNTIASARFVEHYARERGHTASCMHADIPSTRRAAEYEAFRAGRTQLLVCSDCAARGLDNLAVDHVVLFDFPSSAVDYLHRAGRTARAGALGTVTSLVTKRDARLARAIQKAARESTDALEGARVAREEELFKKSEAERLKRAQEKIAKAAAFEAARDGEGLDKQRTPARGARGRALTDSRGRARTTGPTSSRGRGRFNRSRSRSR